jgi:hypothetical protein
VKSYAFENLIFNVAEHSGLASLLLLSWYKLLLSTDVYRHSVIHLQDRNLATCTCLYKNGQLHVLIPYEFDITTTTTTTTILILRHGMYILYITTAPLPWRIKYQHPILTLLSGLLL